MPRALLLDLDNTAYAYAPCHEAGLVASQHVAAMLNPRWTDDAAFRSEYDAARRAVKVHTAGTAAEHCRLLYFKVLTEQASGRTNLHDAAVLHTAYWEGYFGAMRREPGCAELLADRRARGVQLAWVTNFTTERQMRKLHALGLADAADFLVTSEEAGAEKPDPRPLRLALERLGVAASDAVLVGDGVKDDGEAARAAGVKFIWYCRKDREVSPPADTLATVRDWFELRTVLDAHLPG